MRERETSLSLSVPPAQIDHISNRFALSKNICSAKMENQNWIWQWEMENGKFENLFAGQVRERMCQNSFGR